MRSTSRRRVLLAMGAMPIMTLTAGQAMRYLCEEVFPSGNEKAYYTASMSEGMISRSWPTHGASVAARHLG
jgi:hypothetical protein